jgi:hypothetical protein
MLSRQRHRILLGLRGQVYAEYPMLCVHALASACLIVAGILVEESVAQRPKESLKVTSEQPVRVYVWARGGKKPSKQWNGPYQADVKNPAIITLGADGIGFEPFDVVIRQSNGTDTLFTAVNLCSMMKECEHTGKTSWPLTAKAGRWTGSAGHEVYTTEKKTRTIEADADAFQITIPFYPSGGAGNIDPKDPIPPK